MSRPRGPFVPADQPDTVRRRIVALLETGTFGALEISQAVHASVLEVQGHLEHIARTLRAEGRRLVVEPATCKACGHAFQGKLSRPSRCPRCRGERIAMPRFTVK
jgi:predicted Zn-ribbon and HTH transcriptional regulator